MRNWKTLFFLLVTFALPSIPEPSFGKQVWLSCKNKTYRGEPSKSNHSYIINLDYTKERFEITEETGEIYQGRAIFFESAIKLEYIMQMTDFLKFERVWEISRTSLNYSSSIVSSLGGPSVITGSCKAIPAPSSKNKLI